MSLTLSEIDHELELWQERLSVVRGNLLELDDVYASKRLRGEIGAPVELTGVTREKVAPALEAVQELWRYLPLLTDVIDRATAQRKAIPKLWVTEAALAKIEELLRGQSIAFPATVTPLARRTLLTVTASVERISPERLLIAMTKAFEVARDAVLATEAAWNRLEPTLVACDNQIEALQQRADQLGDIAVGELAPLKDRIAALHQLVESDPLGVLTDLSSEVTPLLQRARERVEGVERERDQILTALRRGSDIRDEIVNWNRRAATARETAQREIPDATGLLPPVGENQIIELADWRTSLEAAASAKRWKPLSVGLERWQVAASKLLAEARAAAEANEAPLRQRDDLKGRLAALRAKERTFRQRGIAFDPNIAAPAEEAEGLLRHATSLVRAAALVQEYENRLRNATR